MSVEQWYDFIPVRFEIVKASQRREFAFLKPVNIRALNLWKVDHLNNYFEVANFYKKNPNMYLSVARLKHIPIFTYNPKKRSSETSKWFRSGYFQEVIGYDLFMDFDKEEDEDWERIIEEVMKFKGYLEDYQVPYYLMFSGNKGFQITIPYEALPENLSFEVNNVGSGVEGSVYIFTKVFQEKAKEIFELKHLDLSNNGIPNRLRKMPYSLVKEYVALPLSDADFNNWRLENMHYQTVIRNITLKNRGLLQRDYGLTIEELRKNFVEFTGEILGLKC